MKYLIIFLGLILFASCHNKNDLKKIKELQIQNANWKSEVDKWNILYAKARKSYLGSECCAVYDYILINQTSQKRIQLNQEKFESQLRFCIDNSHSIRQFYYSIPQKIKLEEPELITIKNGNRFSFVPTDTGWYYWKGNSQVKNDRTGEIKNYPITDSFYVYK